MPIPLLLRLRDLPVRYKVLAGGLLPLCVSVGLGGILASYHLEGVLVAQLDQQLRTTSTLIGGMVETAAETTIRNHLRSLAETYRAHAQHLRSQVLKGQLTEAEAQRRCLDLLLAQRVGQTGYLYVIDPQGWVQAHPSQRYVGTNTAHFPYVRQQLDLREGYMEYTWANPGDPAPRPKALYTVHFKPWNWLITASSYRAEFASLLNVGDFRQPIQSLRLGQGGDPFILDTQGRLLLRAQETGNGLEDAQEPHARAFLGEILRRRQGEVTGLLQVPGHAGPRLIRCHFREIPDLGWIVGTRFDLEETFQPLRILRRGLLVLSIFSALMVIPLALWVSGRLTRPLTRLARAFEGGYRVGIRIPETSQDEIGRLGSAFNGFIEALEQAQAERRTSEARQREELELLVAQRTEELLEALQVAEKATRAKSEFLSSMSHELRTPLNAILLYSELLQDEAVEAGLPTLSQDLGKIRRAGDHLLGLINNILDLAKIEAGRVDLHFEALDLHPLMGEVQFTLQPLMERRQNRLILDCPAELPPVRADLLRLRQVLINLGSNAAKFTDTGTITIQCQEAEGGLAIAVTDTGPGISPQEQERIFEAFHQTELGRERGGTGLGLAISHSLTQHMGGRLTVESQPGTGTTFRVWLPRA